MKNVVGIPEEFYNSLMDLLSTANDWLSADSVQSQNHALIQMGYAVHDANASKPKGLY